MTKKEELLEAKELLATAREMAETEKEICLDSIADNKCDETKLRTYLEEQCYGKLKEEKIIDVIKKLKEDTTDEEKAALFERLRDENAVILMDDKPAEMVMTALEMCGRMMDSEQDLFELEKELTDEAKSYTEFLTSMDYYKLQEKKTQQLRQELENAKADKNKLGKVKKLEKSIRRMNGRYNFSFMDDGKTSMKDITRKFFSDKESAYIMSRFGDKCKQAGFDPTVYRRCFNIEENRLEEKYHPFNNLFLFRCMRYIGWADISQDRNEVGTVLNLLMKIVYDKFPSEQIKQETLQAIREWLDPFIEAGFTEEYLEKNILHPKHPVRLAKDKEREESLRQEYYKIFKEKGFVEEITPEIEAMSIPELRRFLDEKNLERGKKMEEETGTIEEAAKKAATVVADSVVFTDSVEKVVKAENEVTENVD